MVSGGEGGIRTLDTVFGRYNRLAGDPVQPLQHLSTGKRNVYRKTGQKSSFLQTVASAAVLEKRDQGENQLHLPSGEGEALGDLLDGEALVVEEENLLRLLTLREGDQELPLLFGEGLEPRSTLPESFRS